MRVPPRNFFLILRCFIHLCSPGGPPCTVILFTVPFHGKASCTRCLPIDDRLTRNALEESILQEVDGVEESSIAAVGICIFETLVVLSMLVATCVKRVQQPSLLNAHDTRATPRRNTIYEESLSAIRYDYHPVLCRSIGPTSIRSGSVLDLISAVELFID